VFESLDCGRRTNTKRKDEARRFADGVRRHDQNGADEERDWPVDRTTENSGMRHGADGTLVARKLGIVRVYMDCLDDAGERDQQDTQQRQSCDGPVFVRARFVSR
jgi:hypothetical protein